MSIEVRPVGAEDSEGVLTVARGLAAWFQPLDQMALAIDLREHEGLVALSEGELVGFVTYHLLDPQQAELSWLGVLPEVQGQGVGARLLTELEARLAARGVRHLELNTVPADYNPAFAATNDFYLRHGFTVQTRDENFYAHARPGIRLEKTLTVGCPPGG
ncbi:MAG: GNAT family N-acetyltransferase [Ardenticatenaceae bacterium]